MAKKFFDEEEKYEMDLDDELDEMEGTADTKEQKNKGGAGKLLLAVCAIALTGAVAGFGSLGISALHDASAKKEMKKAVDEYIQEADTGMEERINEAIDAYTKENQPVSIKDLVGEEGEKELMDSILSDLGDMELTDTQKEQLSEVLTEIFSEDGSFTISGKAIFSDESKAYLTKMISEELAKTMTDYLGESAEGQSIMTRYEELEKAVEKIVSSETGKANISYSLTDSDRDKIKESVISALGNLKGADGKNGSDGKDGINGKDGSNGKDGKDGDDGKDGEDGSDGRDGRDGRDGSDGKDGVNGTDGRDGKDGADGYTPKKGVDYFTDNEIDSFVDNIEKNLKDYFERHEVDEISAMSESIKKDVLSVFTESVDDMDQKLAELSKEYDDQIADAKEEVTKGYTGLIASLEQKITELISRESSGLSQSIEENSRETNEKIVTLEGNTNEKITAIESTVDERIDNLSGSVNTEIDKLDQSFSGQLGDMQSEIDILMNGRETFELIDNGDGTYRLNITDPASGQ